MLAAMSLYDKRLVIVSGKGGVGKSTVSAAIGMAAAGRGRQTLLVEVASQERMSLLFDQGGPIGYHATPVYPGLDAFSIDPQKALEEYLVSQLKVRAMVERLTSSAGFGHLTAAAPGLRELVTLAKIRQLLEHGRHDFVVVDAPAGNSVGKRITPAVHWGIRVMSVGFFVERDGAVVWRGPMIHKLLQQFIEDVDWGGIDYLVVDLPPGTGDAQLSLSQLIPITGSVIVTTPQEVALIDVVKAVSMFKKVEIPVLGVVENMSYYVCPACGHHDEIFSRGGGRKLAEELKAPFLGEVPIDARVRYGGDSGRPVVVGAPDSEHAKLFLDIASKVAGEIIKINGPAGGTGRRAPGLVQIR